MVSVEVTKVYYRALKDGKNWCESSDLDEVKMMSEGYDNIVFQKLTRTTVTGDWQPLTTMDDSNVQDDTIYDEGTYLNAAGEPVVVLVRPDQPTDHSQVKAIVQGGKIVRIPW